MTISQGVPSLLPFLLGARRQLYNVTIVDDQTPENSEFFIADIVSAGPPGVIIGSPKLPLIEIIDLVDGE